MPKASADWDARLKTFVQGLVKNNEIDGYTHANVDAILAAVAGRGPDKVKAAPNAGARMVVNIASVHVPAFCNASRIKDPKPYKNGYDLKNYRIGDSPADEKLKCREIVDRALPLDEGVGADNVYFGAVELNGTGIRFYGDLCFVIKRDDLDDKTVVLDRNSYDLIRAPIRDAINSKPEDARDQARKDEAWKLRGSWGDIGEMTALKALQVLGPRTRRYTTGQISEVVRDDEDYFEVLKIESFGTDNLQEARLSAAEAAHDALTADRARSHPRPRLEALMACNRRRRAEEELRRMGVPVRVVTTSGRTKH